MGAACIVTKQERDNEKNNELLFQKGTNYYNITDNLNDNREFNNQQSELLLEQNDQFNQTNNSYTKIKQRSSLQIDNEINETISSKNLSQLIKPNFFQDLQFKLSLTNFQFRGDLVLNSTRLTQSYYTQSTSDLTRNSQLLLHLTKNLPIKLIFQFLRLVQAISKIRINSRIVIKYLFIFTHRDIRELYSEILKFETRYWYDELGQLHKQQKTNQIYSDFNYSKKYLQIEEQFRVFAQAVILTCFDCNESTIANDYHQYFLDQDWNKGFIWKGVYFQRFHKKTAYLVKQEYKAMKYLTIEYLDHNIKEFIMPLFHITQNPFEIYLATPIIYSDFDQQNQKNDFLNKIQSQYNFTNLQNLQDIAILENDIFLAINAHKLFYQQNYQYSILYYIPQDPTATIKLFPTQIKQGISLKQVAQILKIEESEKDIENLIEQIRVRQEYQQIDLILIQKKGQQALNERSSQIAESYGDTLMLAKCNKVKCKLKKNMHDNFELIQENLDKFAKEINQAKIYVQDLKNHRKRRLLKKWHLWIIYIKVSNQMNKKLIACQIIVDLIESLKPTNIQEFNQLFSDVLNEQFQLQLLFRTYFIYPYLQFMTLQQINYLFSYCFISEIFELAKTSSHLLIQLIESQLKISLKIEKLKQIRCDSYYLKFNNNELLQFQYEFESQAYFQKKERQYYLLEKQIKNSNHSLEIYFPNCFYKLENKKNIYIMVSPENLNDWINFLELLYQPQDQIEAILISIISLIFQENDEDQAMFQLEKIVKIFQQSRECQVQHQILCYTLMGFLLEKKSIMESQHNYIIAILLIHNYYGDPRCRGIYPCHFELFPLYRLSVMSHLQDKVQDYEVISELIESIQSSNIPFTYWTHHYTYQNKQQSQVLQASFSFSQLFPWFWDNFVSMISINKQWNVQQIHNKYMKMMYQYHIPKGQTISSSMIYQFSIATILSNDEWTCQKQEGSLYLWGFNTNGQIANKSSQCIFYYPRIVLKDQIIISVCCGHKHTMALNYLGQIYAWGDNEYGKCGVNPSYRNISQPTIVQGLKHVLQIQSASDHSMCLTNKQQVYTWGCGEGGLLGNGQLVSTHIPQLIIQNNIESIQTGGLHSIALTKFGQIYVWGRGEGGQLGIENYQYKNDEIYVTTPQKVEIEKIKQVALGDAHTIALSTNGEIYGWGYSNVGQLGIGITDNDDQFVFLKPTIIDTLRGKKILKIFAGSLFSMFLDDKQDLYACGQSDTYQCGIEQNCISKPIKIYSRILNLSCGQGHCIAQGLTNQSEYAIYTWGINRYGELGIGNPKIASSDAQIIFNNISFSMDCGGYHSGIVLGKTTQYKNSQVKDSKKKSGFNVQLTK